LAAALAAAAFSITCTSILSGCNAAEMDDGNGTVPQPKAFSFDGTVDSKYVGTWKSATNSMLELNKDGTVSAETIAHTAGGISDVRIKGQWLVKDNKISVRYPDKAKNLVTMQYVADLSGNKLDLTISNTKIKTTYFRK
jgi:hypothetical protein